MLCFVNFVFIKWFRPTYASQKMQYVPKIHPTCHGRHGAYRWQIILDLFSRDMASKKLWHCTLAGVWCIYGSRARDLFGNLWILSTLPRHAYFLSLCFLFPLPPPLSLSLFVCGSRTCGFMTIHSSSSSSSNEWYDIWNRNDSCSQLIKTFLPRKLCPPVHLLPPAPAHTTAQEVGNGR